jgi:hypothetical protein
MTALPGLLSTPSDFVTKDIFELLGLQSISQQKKDDLLDVMLYTVTNRVMAQILDQLSKEQQEKLEVLLEEDDTEKLVAFLEERGIDYNELFSQEALIYKAEMVNLASNPAVGKKYLEG